MDLVFGFDFCERLARAIYSGGQTRQGLLSIKLEVKS
jgi:hypothetical protein